MSSDWLNCSKICLTELAVFPLSSTFTCSTDKLTKALAYRKAISSDWLNCSKICLTEWIVLPSSSTFTCSADKLTKALAYRKAISSEFWNFKVKASISDMDSLRSLISFCLFERLYKAIA